MPALRVPFPATEKLGRFDVVGECTGDQRGFVRHVALHNADGHDVSHGDAVDVVHMGPPLQTDGAIRVHAAGRVPLTVEEITRIEAWIEKIVDEYQAADVQGRQQYVIHPPWEDRRDQNTGVRRYRRFSCAGFVLDAYSQVDIELLEIEEAALPGVDRETLLVAYPRIDRVDLGRFGLHGDGPWRIVLAGYVLHALNRATQEVRQEPYRAKPGNGFF